MKFIAFIKASQPAVIERILSHLGLWSDESTSRQTGPPLWLQIAQAQGYLEDHPEYSPDWEGSQDELHDDATDEPVACADDAYHDQTNWA